MTTKHVIVIGVDRVEGERLARFLIRISSFKVVCCFRERIPGDLLRAARCVRLESMHKAPEILSTIDDVHAVVFFHEHKDLPEAHEVDLLLRWLPAETKCIVESSIDVVLPVLDPTVWKDERSPLTTRKTDPPKRKAYVDIERKCKLHARCSVVRSPTILFGPDTAQPKRRCAIVRNILEARLFVVAPKGTVAFCALDELIRTYNRILQENVQYDVYLPPIHVWYLHIFRSIRFALRRHRLQIIPDVSPWTIATYEHVRSRRVEVDSKKHPEQIVKDYCRLITMLDDSNAVPETRQLRPLATATIV